ncbi:allantoate permease [Diaporthe sp. PMI_573]|nr:allantoate permease [Diaporthaceae sp. PMI_573]
MGLEEKAVVSETRLDGSREPSEVKSKSSWKGYLWDTWALPQDQRRLLFKLDAFVLTFASIGYFLKNLDQTNVSNAFLSGMKEDLRMYGNELVTSTSIYTVGYVIGQIPSNLLLTRVSPRWVIPMLECGWGIATICTASVKSYRSLYALRFLVGLFESGFYPGIHYMLGSWYTPREIGKRAMVFWLAGSIGQMFSGLLQAAAYTNLSGKGGLAGWKWLFIVDGIITIPLALAGFVFFPNMPGGGKTWWITEAENTLSVERMKAVGRAGKQPWTRAKVKKILCSWHTYLLPLCYVVWNNGWAQPAMGYWLKSFNETPAPVPGTSFSVAEINDLPLPTTGIFVVMALIWGWASDGPCHGIRWPFIYVGAAITLLFSVLLRQMPLYENITGRMVVFWFSQIGNGAGPLILTWINEICSDDTEKRALIVALGNDLAYVVQAVAPNFVWKTTDFPAARKGYLWCIVMQILLVLVTASIQILLWRDGKKATAAVEGSLSPSPSPNSDDPGAFTSDVDERQTVTADKVSPV